MPGSGYLYTAFALALGILLLIAAVSAYSIHTFITTARWVDDINEVRVQVQDLNANYYRLRIPWRNYLVRHDTASRAQFEEAASRLRGSVEVLRTLVSDVLAQRERVDALRQLIEGDIEMLSAGVRRKAAGNAQDPLAEISAVTARDLRRLSVETLLAALSGHEERLLAERRQEWERNAQRAFALIIAGNLVSLAILVAVFAMLRRENRARSAAQRAAERYAAETEDLYNNAPCGYHSLDADGRFVQINDTELRWLGYAREEVIGRLRFTDLLAPEAWAEFDRCHADLKSKGGVRDVECEMIRKDGTMLPVLLNASAIFDESGRFLVCRSTTFDISERRRAEQALRRSAEDMRSIQEAVYAISQAADGDAAITMLLEKVCGFSGCPYGQAWIPEPDGGRLVCGPAWFHRRPAFDRFRHLNRVLSFRRGEGYLGRIWAGGEPSWEWNLEPQPGNPRRELILETGFRSWIGFPVVAGSEIVAVIEFFEIEHSERSERTLNFISVLAAQIAPVLERMWAQERAAALNSALEQRSNQLEAANRELESFSYSVSHDLRVPLRAIDGFSRMLEEDYQQRLDDEGRRLLGVVRENARKMGQLIEDLLAFSRLGRKPIAPQEIDMAAQARAVFDEVVDGSRVRLDIGALPPAAGDPVLVKQVWQNLLGNAVKFSSRSESPVVSVTGRAEADANVYCVKDNGAGFDMRYADKLFGVFQRLHSAEEFSGTGVGLAIVQRVVARHGGRVWAEGEIGKGAAFFFSLPRCEP